MTKIVVNQMWTGPYDQYTGDISRDSWSGHDPFPYPSDLLAEIPWAKEAGLELKRHESGKDDDRWWSWVCGEYSWNIWENIWEKHKPRMWLRSSCLVAPPTTPPPGYVALAQPSVGERLADAAYAAYTHGCYGSHRESAIPKDWLNVALAVRREVLSEIFSKEDEDAAFDEYRKIGGVSMYSRDGIVRALSAAIASRVARESKVTP